MNIGGRTVVQHWNTPGDGEDGQQGVIGKHASREAVISLVLMNGAADTSLVPIVSKYVDTVYQTHK